MHRAQEQVRDFERANHTARFRGQELKQRLESRKNWIQEEWEELIEALEQEDIFGTVREMCDMMYHIYGMACDFGLDLEPFFEEVHRANMDKCGGPVREDGKRLKPEGWSPPDMRAVFYRRPNI